jgi:uncharacterized membrane protein
VVSGIGLGGFIDGIVLHQILQWHHMLSLTDEYGGGTVEDLRVNVLADGLFHAFTWIAVAAGLWLVFRLVRSGAAVRGKELFGWILVGWGAFNLVEGVVNHHLLGIHRVRPAADEPLLWDIAFLALGVVLLAAGVWLARSSRSSARSGLESGAGG